MREIKFRAWNPFDKKMYYATGDESALSPVSYEFGLWLGGWEMYEITAQYGKRIVVASETRQGHKGGELMQYTGLKDKNEVEIYEGDVLSDGYHSNIVEFLDGMFCVMYKGHQYYKTPQRLPVINIAGRSQVIGNIYENPELLEKKA